MKLTNDDKKYLKALGALDEDFKQLEEAMSKTIYTLEDGSKISRKKTIDILGREEYLSGILRSAFHYTTARFNKDESIVIYFDSSLLFE